MRVPEHDSRRVAVVGRNGVVNRSVSVTRHLQRDDGPCCTDGMSRMARATPAACSPARRACHQARSRLLRRPTAHPPEHWPRHRQYAPAPNSGRLRSVVSVGPLLDHPDELRGRAGIGLPRLCEPSGDRCCGSVWRAGGVLRLRPIRRAVHGTRSAARCDETVSPTLVSCSVVGGPRGRAGGYADRPSTVPATTVARDAAIRSLCTWPPHRRTGWSRPGFRR